MGFSNERMRTAQLAGWFLLEGIELTPAGNPITQPQELPFGVDHLIGFNELLTCKHPESAGVHFFLDDYQFERFWRMPGAVPLRAGEVPAGHRPGLLALHRTSPRPSSTGTTTGTSC